MHVLSICETAMGGVGIYQNQLGEIQSPGLSFHVLAPHQHRDFLNPDLPVSTFDRPARGMRAIINLLRQFLRLRRQETPDLYFFHSSFALLPLLLLRILGDRTPALYCAHGWAVGTMRPDGMGRRLIAMAERRLTRLADHVVNVSQHDQQLAVENHYHPHMSVIENAVPDRVAGAGPAPVALTPPETDASRINLLFVGRFDRQKGLDLLLPAFATARGARPDLDLYLIGGAVRGKDAPEIPPYVNNIGWVDHAQLDAWFSFADAVIVPSRWEGLPLVIPEALRNGTPVFCAETSGMERLITKGKTGDHFPLTVDAIAAMLAGLDADGLAAMRPACRQLYENRYALPRWRDEISRLIRDMAGKGVRK